MGRDNKDRYGWRHRRDGAYEMGESTPGTTGESEGTFYDRATSDNNVISGGKARSYESHKRNKSQRGSLASRSRNITATESKSKNSDKQHSHTNHSDLDGSIVEVTVDRISNSGNPIAIYRGSTIHVKGGKAGQTYRVELSARTGYFKGSPKLRE